MSDDNKLKVILYTMVVLTVIAVIGAWELFIQPILSVVLPFIAETWNSMMGTLGSNL